MYSQVDMINKNHKVQLPEQPKAQKNHNSRTGREKQL